MLKYLIIPDCIINITLTSRRESRADNNFAGLLMLTYMIICFMVDLCITFITKWVTYQMNIDLEGKGNSIVYLPIYDIINIVFDPKYK